ncbi:MULTISPECIES: proton-translocating transhydrogenase family protein [Legionella]|uniref:proton-translocating NAD(P)(+) transhydrogenase n=1 Tax=Legionella septentrionalis TaxID=2498109 RepID=A0A433JHE8_9GAMM|nr:MULTISPECIES: proton-translocating transhydrogenase family protein [Legionella]MCP0914683.1 proton-translocating transhydrogenase family protein [Legionella sp. 27cVA30]RUQ81601.1 NAD(P) transhydrogenase subunit alpha [Legionella septentrionalis]RUQ95753.1 NAD(P) transhydrogenase subunit alpha [Legionella septentrionalis]RUR09133.1 NAD(P) transhydrogenase subunit alpha [Legionella septentrionalis]RUR15640.1 NAD(P) transhydrogenase subunit alpha [Legionella septentrionalis]
MPHIDTLSNPYLAILIIFVLASFVGYYVVWKVTPALHTPLMSVTNAISGIIILGALIAAGSQASFGVTVLGGLAVFIAAINIFGGFVVTQRMLRMYKK